MENEKEMIKNALSFAKGSETLKTIYLSFIP
jgi:hypothetical protein